MSHAIQAQLDRLYRRVLMMVAPVKILATDDTGPVHRTQVRVTPSEIIDNIPTLMHYGLASHAMPGSDAHAMFIGGNRANPVIVGTNNQPARMRNLQPGEVALYTDEGDYVKLARGRIIEVNCGTKITITCPLVELTGDLHVQGEVIRGYGTSDSVTLGQHKHNQPPDGHGDGEEPTDPPTAGT